MKFIIFSAKFLLVSIICGLMILAGCKEDSPEKTNVADDKKKETKEVTVWDFPESGLLKTPKHTLTDAEVVELVGKPGKFKLFYTHGGICLPCMEIITRFESVVKNQYPEEIEFYHYHSIEIEKFIQSFGLSRIESSGTMFVFDKDNKSVVQTFNPQFEDVIEGLKVAGFTKQVTKPELPPDFFNPFSDDYDYEGAFDGFENSD